MFSLPLWLNTPSFLPIFVSPALSTTCRGTFSVSQCSKSASPGEPTSGSEASRPSQLAKDPEGESPRGFFVTSCYQRLTAGHCPTPSVLCFSRESWGCDLGSLTRARRELNLSETSGFSVWYILGFGEYSRSRRPKQAFRSSDRVGHQAQNGQPAPAWGSFPSARLRTPGPAQRRARASGCAHRSFSGSQSQPRKCVNRLSFLTSVPIM